VVIKIPSGSDGFARAVSEAVTGLVVILIARAFLVSSGYGSLAFLVNIFSIIGIILLVDKMPFWGIGYTLGWLIGIVYIGSKLMEWWEIPIYIVIGFFFLYIKFSHKFD
jgi:hypothetical protein